MTEFKLYGKTYVIKDKIKEFAISLGGFIKYDKTLRIVLTKAKTTKGRTKKIHEFAKENNLKCYECKYDGSHYAPSDVNYSSFGKSLE
jgi:hypothetical protein